MSTSATDFPPLSVSFSVTARSDPGVLPRILELFAKRGLVPARFHADRVAPSGDMLRVEIGVTEMDTDLAHYIGRCLRAIFAVEQVLVTGNARSDAA